MIPSTRVLPHLHDHSYIYNKHEHVGICTCSMIYTNSYTIRIIENKNKNFICTFMSIYTCKEHSVNKEHLFESKVVYLYVYLHSYNKYGVPCSWEFSLHVYIQL